MKQKFKSFVFAAAFSLVCISSFGQQGDKGAPAWVSSKGYWVLESNINTPLSHVIRFYNNDNSLLYKEQVEGVRIDIAKRKVKMKLKKVLESAVIAWESKKVLEENKYYVASVLK